MAADPVYTEACRRIAAVSNTNTTRTYSSRIKGYLQWCRTVGIAPESAVADAVRDYLGSAPWADATKITTTAALEALYDVMEGTWTRTDNPAREARLQIQKDKNRFGGRQRKPTKLPSTLDADEEQLLLTITQITPSQGLTMRRPHQVLRLLLWTGLRREEAANLLANDIRLLAEAPYLRVKQGKGGKERTVPMHIRLADELRDYSIMREDTLIRAGYKPSETGALPYFCNAKGKGYDGSSIYRIAQRILQKAGIDKWQMGPHVLRHTFATRQLQAGIPPAIVKLWMGHKDVSVLFKTYEHVTQGNSGVMPI
jgi:integrase/recombinase XerD